MGAQFSFADEVVFFSLCSVEFECEGVSTEIVEGITKARGASCVYGEHVLALRVSVG